ncbi:methyltransferase [Jannaschia pagri]|uniref:Methyltransferase n=1 Tax=Jannaschia pagri TaxID=2829797 RepID=A0ABQ4NQP3_9RHOB|nr:MULTISPECIES: DUF938 domain-containing protein [unclassified Jannaschia]GIT92858.1 methyltransferase [Jannaschia sp. AI_61]GIT96693.1 methyltransferase [Jannaschia sp. AI_62]
MKRSIVTPDGVREADANGLMCAAAATRNLQPILEGLLPHLPRAGDVLELASGTGQHIAALAAHRPDLTFHPTDADAARRDAIDARCQGLPNVAPAGDLDVGVPGWAVAGAAQAILIVNLLHLISDGELSVLLDQAERALSDGGLLAIYGPFLRDGEATSDGDRRFDADLRAQDGAIGYKDIGDLQTVLTVLGFDIRIQDMPANNLMILAQKATSGGGL